MLREGHDRTEQFDKFLIEEQDVDGTGIGNGLGFVTFLNHVSYNVKEYMKWYAIAYTIDVNNKRKIKVEWFTKSLIKLNFVSFIDLFSSPVRIMMEIQVFHFELYKCNTIFFHVLL